MPRLEIYGSEGILEIGDPNQFGAPVYLRKPNAERTAFPFTHGYLEESRGLGAAEMAWSIRAGRNHRASMEMAFHVFELIHGMYLSSSSGRIYELQSAFDIPQPLPPGYLDHGFWGPTPESALV